jgi:hypothetical protein
MNVTKRIPAATNPAATKRAATVRKRGFVTAAAERSRAIFSLAATINEEI